MRWHFVLIPVVALALQVSLDAARAEDKVDDRKVTRLIGQLGSEKYTEREEAARALEALAAAALEPLRQASRDPDLEVQDRAQELVRRIEKRLETDRDKDVPLADAIADFARQSGCALQLSGDLGKLADRKITLDTGETTFWPALDLFCVKAGLLASSPPPPAKPARQRPDTFEVLGNQAIISGIPVGGGGAMPPRNVLLARDAEQPNSRLLLTDGQPAALPTHYAGNLRVRALPVKQGADAAKGTDTIALDLEVSASPGMQCNRVLGVRIQRAIDDQGQTLTQRLHVPVKPAPSRPRDRDIIFNNIAIDYSEQRQSLGYPPTQVPIRLQGRGEHAPKAVKELSGTLVAHVRSPPQTLVTVDEILKAADRTVRGAASASIKVLEVARGDNNQVRLRLVVAPAASRLSDGTDELTALDAVLLGNRSAASDPDRRLILTAANFSSLDDQGRPFETIKAVNKGTEAAQELELVYRPAQGQTEPSRLLYTGSAGALVEVPFTLKAIPLP